MGNEMVQFQESNSGLELAAEFMPVVAEGLTDDLSQGVGGGFAAVSIRAGKFRIKYKGNEIPITDEKGDPVGSIEAVLVRANAHITKQWFSKPYDEGDTMAPDCFSLDGVSPSPTSPMVQAKSCAVCPKNAFGSAPPRDGRASKGKACQDNRKLAIVPLADIDNEAFGGPMLFRVPPSALQDLAAFGAAWKARGYPYNAIGVRIGMDMEASYPKPTFKAIRPLTSEEAVKILALVHSPAVEKILVDFDPGAAPVEAVAAEGFEQPAPVAPPAPAAHPQKPVAAQGPKLAAHTAATAAKPVTPKPAPTATFIPKGAPTPPAEAPAPKAATFGAKAAPKPAAAPKAAKPAKAPAPPVAVPVVTQEAEGEGEAEPQVASGDDDIESILKDLNSNAG